MSKDEHIQKRPLPVKAKMKIMMLVSDGDLVSAQLDNNPTHIINIGETFPNFLEGRLIRRLKANVDLFVVSPKEILSIDPNMAYHYFSFNPSTRYIT